MNARDIVHPSTPDGGEPEMGEIKKDEKHKWRTVGNLVSFLLLAIIIVALGKYLYENREQLATLKSVSWSYLILSMIAYSLSIEAKGISFNYTTEVFGVVMSRPEYLGLTAMSTLTNYTLPFQAGIGVKAIYLKKCKKLNYIEFISLATLCTLFATAFYSVGAMLFLLADYFFKEMVKTPLFLVFGIYTFLIVVFYFFILPSSFAFLKKINLLYRGLQGWQILKYNKTLLLKWSGSIIACLILDIAIFYFITRSMSLYLTISTVAILALTKQCSLLVKITPASLGITEGLLMYLCLLYGINATNGLIIVFLSRIVELVPASLFSAFLYSRLKKNLKLAECH